MDGQAAPEYLRAADVIKSRIQSGSISIGSLVTIKQIAKVAGTTYSTARTTADHLEAEGILKPHQGKGYEVIATPEKAAAERADATELARQVAQLRGELRALSARVDAADEKLERVDSSLEDLHEKLGYDYAADGSSERGNEPAPAARRGRTG